MRRADGKKSVAYQVLYLAQPLLAELPAAIREREMERV